MDPRLEHEMLITRRQLFGRAGVGVGAIALAHLFGAELEAADGGAGASSTGAGVAGFPNFAARAKRVIYLFQSGAPSQMDLFDPKPGLARLQGDDLPDSIRMGQRLTGMTSRQDKFPVAASKFAFKRHGGSGAQVSELMPFTAKIADELCFIRSMHTEAINHDPAVTFFPDRGPACGAPEHRVVGGVRAGKRQPGFACVCGDDLAGIGEP